MASAVIYSQSFSSERHSSAEICLHLNDLSVSSIYSLALSYPFCPACLIIPCAVGLTVYLTAVLTECYLLLLGP